MLFNTCEAVLYWQVEEGHGGCTQGQAAAAAGWLQRGQIICACYPCPLQGKGISRLMSTQRAQGSPHHVINQAHDSRLGSPAFSATPQQTWRWIRCICQSCALSSCVWLDACSEAMMHAVLAQMHLAKLIKQCPAGRNCYQTRPKSARNAPYFPCYTHQVRSVYTVIRFVWA